MEQPARSDKVPLRGWSRSVVASAITATEGLSVTSAKGCERVDSGWTDRRRPRCPVCICHLAVPVPVTGVASAGPAAVVRVGNVEPLSRRPRPVFVERLPRTRVGSLCERRVKALRAGSDAPIGQDTRSGGLDDLLASAEIGHDALVDLASEETFQAPDDLSRGSAVRRAACDVINGRLMVPHADDDGSIEGGVGVSVAASIEAVPAGGHPGRGRDRTRVAELREGGFRTNPVGIIAEDDQQFGRGVGAHTEALTEGR